MVPKAGVQEHIEAIRTDLLELSHRIHAHPELGFEEERACAWLSYQAFSAGSAFDAATVARTARASTASKSDQAETSASS